MEELFYIPSSIKEEIKEENFHSEFIFSPLERGFGHTIGNALRRTLISSITGYAIIGVVIDGVQHKFDTIEGVRETVVDIVYNLKQVRFKVDEDVIELPTTMELNVTGKKSSEKVIKASDIDCPAGIEIINADAYIATIEKGKFELSIKIKIDKGKGLMLAEARGVSGEEIGFIPVDALFSPVEKVQIEVDSNTRFRDRADYDTLKISLFTDGTVSPKEAMEEAANILYNHFAVISGIVEKEEEDYEEKPLNVYELDLDEKYKNILEENGYSTISKILEEGKKEIGNIKGIGAKALKAIEEALEKAGYSLE